MWKQHFHAFFSMNACGVCASPFDWLFTAHMLKWRRAGAKAARAIFRAVHISRAANGKR